MARLEIVRAGLLTTVQDQGRWGYQAFGVSVSGAMDPRSQRLSNLLVGNSSDCAVLESTMAGPEVVIDEERVVAVTGADCEVTLDKQPIPMNRPVTVRAGEVLRLGARVRGVRTYLAVEGGIDVAAVLGSRATHVVTGLGGFHGRPLKAGDVLPLGRRPARGSLPSSRVQEVPRRLTELPAAEQPTRLRVLAGPQVEWFGSDVLEHLTSAPYTVSENSNRMGYRLAGPAIPRTRDDDMISDATPIGALQVPGGGHPILLMADRQTTGGYPQVAVVISADIPVAGQLGPGDRLHFALCSRREAVAALIAQERAFLAIEHGTW